MSRFRVPRWRGVIVAAGAAAALSAAVAMAADTVFVDGDTAAAAPNLAYGGGGRDCSTLGQSVSGQIVVNFNGNGGGSGHFAAGESLTVTPSDPADITTVVTPTSVPSNWNDNTDSFTIPFTTTVSSAISDGAYQVSMNVTGDSSGYSAGSGSGDGRPLYVVNISCNTTSGSTNHAPTVVVANASVTVDEHSLATNSGTYADQDGDPVSLSADYGTVVKDADGLGTWTWSATPDDGPSDSRSVVTITASDGSLQGTGTFSLGVNNVPPTVTSLTPNVSQVLVGSPVTFTGAATDPSNADTAAGFNWSFNGGAWAAAGANTFTTTFTTCGVNTVTAQAKDKDGGLSNTLTSDSVSAFSGHYLPPLTEGIYNSVQKGQVVPVKISISCNGANMTGLVPKIQLLSGELDPSTDTGDPTANVTTASVSNADTTGQMRPIDGGYIYNLAVPSASAGTLYTVRVQPFGSAAGGSMYIVIKIRK